MKLNDYKILELAATGDWDRLYDAFLEFEYYLDSDHKFNSDLYSRLEEAMLKRSDFTPNEYMRLSGILSRKYQNYLWKIGIKGY